MSLADLAIIGGSVLFLVASVAFFAWVISRASKYEPSEFGRGIVVPLVKFSQHLSYNDMWLKRALNAWKWLEMEDGEKLRITQEAQTFPKGDAAEFVSSLHLAEVFAETRGGPEKGISHLLEMWMYGASDHFYELDERAPARLHELADLACRMGRPWLEADLGRAWGREDYDRLMKLWEEATLEVEKMLGVTDAHWGEW